MAPLSIQSVQLASLVFESSAVGIKHGALDVAACACWGIGCGRLMLLGGCPHMSDEPVQLPKQPLRPMVGMLVVPAVPSEGLVAAESE